MESVRRGECGEVKREGYRGENMVKVHDIVERNSHETQNHVQGIYTDYVLFFQNHFPLVLALFEIFGGGILVFTSLLNRPYSSHH